MYVLVTSILSIIEVNIVDAKTKLCFVPELGDGARERELLLLATTGCPSRTWPRGYI